MQAEPDTAVDRENSHLWVIRLLLLLHEVVNLQSSFIYTAEEFHRENTDTVPSAAT